MVMKRYILTCICCGIFAGGVLAQQQDSIAKMRDAAAAQDSAMQRRSQADTAYRVKFNAMKYSMQKRYQPKGMEFNNKKFLDNFFFGFLGWLQPYYSTRGYESFRRTGNRTVCN